MESRREFFSQIGRGGLGIAGVSLAATLITGCRDSASQSTLIGLDAICAEAAKVVSENLQKLDTQDLNQALTLSSKTKFIHDEKKDHHTNRNANS